MDPHCTSAAGVLDPVVVSIAIKTSDDVFRRTAATVVCTYSPFVHLMTSKATAPSLRRTSERHDPLYTSPNPFLSSFTYKTILRPNAAPDIRS